MVGEGERETETGGLILFKLGVNGLMGNGLMGWVFIKGWQVWVIRFRDVFGKRFKHKDHMCNSENHEDQMCNFSKLSSKDYTCNI